LKNIHKDPKHTGYTAAFREIMEQKESLVSHWLGETFSSAKQPTNETFKSTDCCANHFSMLLGKYIVFGKVSQGKKCHA
jgi:hypothetical protein